MPKRYAAAEELFSDAELEAFVIVTPDEQHASQGLKALATGKPVFIEKPLASYLEEARQLQQALLQKEVAGGSFGELVWLREEGRTAMGGDSR